MFTKKVNGHRQCFDEYPSEIQRVPHANLSGSVPHASEGQPTMTRNAMPNLASFDPEVLDAARDVARRAGMPLEAWIESVVRSGRQDPKGRRRRPRPDVEAPAAEPVRDSRPAPRRRATVEQDAAPSLEFAPATPVEDRLGETLDALMARLDGVDRALAEERAASQEAARRRMEDIEARITEALGSSTAPVQQVAERLGDIERRMLDLGEQFAASRPPGRRGRPAAEEVRSAVDEIRARQRELGQAPQEARGAEGSIVAAMYHDLARRLDANIHGADPAGPSAAVAELQRETARLRESIGQLATGRDVGALEQAVISLATGVERSQASSELAAIAGPIDLIRAQVERLAEEVAENVHNRVATDVEKIALRLDSVVASGASGTPDRDALAGVFSELEEIRALVAALAGPERIQSLAQGMHAVSAQIAQLQNTAQAGSHEDLRPLLEEIRNGLNAPGPAVLAEQIQMLAAKVDALHGREGAGDGLDSRAILGRIDALAKTVEQAGAQPVGDLIGRLEGLGESLRRPGPESGDLASIHAALSRLAEKVDRVEARTGGEGLDALERQVVTLAGRLDARGADPALAGLERTMGELLGQVSTLRQNPVADDTAPERGELGLIRAGIADIQTRQSASDQRLCSTLEGVQSALERLAGRLGPSDGEAALRAPIATRGPSLDERLLGSTGVEAPRGRSVRRPEAPRSASLVDQARLGDELLEPGAGRPLQEEPRDLAEESLGRPRPSAERVAPAEATEGDIKSSFIAAARRAAQAAQAELAAESSTEARSFSLSKRAAGAAPAGEGRLARLRSEIDRRRRPLLLGLAAIVLVLGALQAIDMGGSNHSEAPRPEIASAPARATPPVAEAPAARPEGAKADAATTLAEAPKPIPADKPILADPQTTQAIGGSAAPSSTTASQSRPAATRPALPPVQAMASLAGDLATLPPALAKVKQSALDGDGAAVWELAGRAMDGRGLTRDLAVAAKLHEKLASAGYAPAQFKLGSHFEKGSGVVRDIAQAKTWYARAAEQGHARAMHNLAVLYAENPGPTGKPDYASAASWFRQGAEAGVRDSQYNLAVLYARGLGLTQDLAQSYLWFSAAAGQGDEDAGKKRDDVAGKLAPNDLANAKVLAANFKPRKLDPAVNDGPAIKDAGPAGVSLLGAPAPSPTAFVLPGRKGV